MWKKRQARNKQVNIDFCWRYFARWQNSPPHIAHMWRYIGFSIRQLIYASKSTHKWLPSTINGRGSQFNLGRAIYFLSFIVCFPFHGYSILCGHVRCYRGAASDFCDWTACEGHLAVEADKLWPAINCRIVWGANRWCHSIHIGSQLTTQQHADWWLSPWYGDVTWKTGRVFAVCDVGILGCLVMSHRKKCVCGTYCNRLSNVNDQLNRWLTTVFVMGNVLTWTAHRVGL